MKQKEITTSKGKFLVVYIPEMTRGVPEFKPGILGFPCIRYEDKTGCTYSPIKYESIEFIGFVKELTEEQWKLVVDDNDNGNYLDYELFRGHLQNYVGIATESGLSLLQANDILLENPYGEEPPSASEMFDGVSNIEHADNCEEWYAAQEEVFNNPVIFKVI